MKNGNFKNMISSIFLTSTMMVTMLPTLTTPVYATTNEIPQEQISSTYKMQVLEDRNTLKDYLLKKATSFNLGLNGDGTPESPFEITSKESLLLVANEIEKGNTNICIKLMNDIDLIDIEWTGIASVEENAFTGTFDGNGKTIHNLHGTEGLFKFNNGTIKNVYLKNVNIKRDGGNLGSIAGINQGIIFGCVTDGNVVGQGGESWSVGGITGWNRGGTIEGCISSCNASGVTVGGIVGSSYKDYINDGKIIMSYYNGNISSKIEGDKGRSLLTDVYFRRDGNTFIKYVSMYSEEIISWEELSKKFNDYIKEKNGVFGIDTIKINPQLNLSLQDHKTDYNYGDLIKINFSIKDNTNVIINGQMKMNVYVHDQLIIQKDFDQSEGQIVIDTADEEISKVLKCSDTPINVTVKFNGYQDLSEKTNNIDISLKKFENQWIEELSIKDWTYGETMSQPSAKSNYGEVTFTYSSEINGTYTKEAPINAGVYYVKATVEEGPHYKDLEAIKQFTINKANLNPTIPANLTLVEGKPLSSIELPKQFKWVDETLSSNKVGLNKFKAIYTPEDTINYNTIEVEIDVLVVPTLVVINHITTISAKDLTLTVGDYYDPLKDVSVYDEEDGNITLTNDHIIKNGVNTSKVGSYEVTYKVSDSKKATITKTIKVTVVEAIEDKEILENAINDKTSNIDKNTYTKESYNAYLNALEKAQAILKNPNASKENIAKALQDLEVAYKALQKVDTTLPNTTDQINVNLYVLIALISSLIFIIVLKKKEEYTK